MKLKTRFFGEIEIDEKKVIDFEEGLPGFENLRKFLFMTDENEDAPFCWLQSIEDIDIVFTLFDIFKYMPNYNPSVEVETLEKLGHFKEEDLLIYCIASIPKDVKNMTVNLKAPVIINVETNKAKQIICSNEEYSIKHYIYKEMLEKRSNKKDGE
nr:flagellar assembly protein FliW [uncultured Tyzzerella sp.]